METTIKLNDNEYLELLHIICEYILELQYKRDVAVLSIYKTKYEEELKKVIELNNKIIKSFN